MLINGYVNQVLNEIFFDKHNEGSRSANFRLPIDG